ncbi:MAG TPA: type II toxin-antitoxin system RelE/ParE family toxin [Polyangiaceae bacterium]|nr:type II toxin-antitoxin system RelE/ParE family toxin [Polyangiaceae bacterium]
MKGKDGIARAIYVTAIAQRVVVVHAFAKKSQRTPQRALDIARTRQGGNGMTIPVSKLKNRWMKQPGFKAGYDALDEEFALARMLIDARVRAKLLSASTGGAYGDFAVHDCAIGKRRSKAQSFDTRAYRQSNGNARPRVT